MVTKHLCKLLSLVLNLPLWRGDSKHIWVAGSRYFCWTWGTGPEGIQSLPTSTLLWLEIRLLGFYRNLRVEVLEKAASMSNVQKCYHLVVLEWLNTLTELWRSSPYLQGPWVHVVSTHLLKQDFKVLLFLCTIEVPSFSRLGYFSLTLSSYSYGLDRPARNRELDSMILKISKFIWIK